jgi:hypothetical protein
MRTASLCMIVLLSVSAQLAPAESPFVSVMYDELSESELGAFPPNRLIWAQTVEALGRLGAKAVVLKFFFDFPKSDSEDKALEGAMKSVATFLQARIDDTDPNPNVVNMRFSIKIQNQPQSLIRGDSGWLPLPMLGNVAYDMGFVDIRDSESVPMLVVYKGNVFKSLWLAVLQYALPSISVNGKSLKYLDKTIVLNRYGEAAAVLPTRDDLYYVRVSDLLHGKVDRSLVANKIAIVGYDGEKQESIRTPIGKVRSHRVFYYWLLGLYRELAE